MTYPPDIQNLFDIYYGDNPNLRRIVTLHSENVAKKALQIYKSKNLELNPDDILYAALLHDIGVVKCNAPDIFAYGNAPYIQHGILGKEILVKHGFDLFSSVCTNHTGAGITLEEIIKNNLPLPHINMVPVTLLEKLICYADKFYSKSKNLFYEKSIDEVISQLKRFGEDSVKRFLELHALFGDTNK